MVLRESPVLVRMAGSLRMVWVMLAPRWVLLNMTPLRARQGTILQAVLRKALSPLDFVFIRDSPPITQTDYTGSWLARVFPAIAASGARRRCLHLLRRSSGMSCCLCSFPPVLASSALPAVVLPIPYLPHPRLAYLPVGPTFAYPA